MNTHETYMWRCLQLAASAAGAVAPNPMVGAVLVCENEVIGEGNHVRFGGPHAEVNCINSVPAEKRHLIAKSCLYVSLEPCNHFGKTPPCSDLIIKHNIPKVVIACVDPFEKVNGSGIQKLRNAGVEVVTGMLEEEALWLNRRFFTFHNKQRPYIILKWAQSSNLKIAGENYQPLKISNDLSNRLVHKWRSEEAAIMVGTNTALHDDPLLTTRMWPGKNAVRVVVDNDLKLPPSLHLLDGSELTIIMNKLRSGATGNNFYQQYGADETLPEATTNCLFKKQLLSLIVEGGTRLLQTFIDAGTWDEARVITNKELQISNGVDAPVLKNFRLLAKEELRTDEIRFYTNSRN